MFSNADIIISKPIITQTRKIKLKNLTAHLIIRELKNAESSGKPNLLQVAVQVRPHKKSNMMSSKAKKKKKKHSNHSKALIIDMQACSRLDHLPPGDKPTEVDASLLLL